MFNTVFRVDQKVLRKSIVLCSLMLFHVQVALAQSAWQDANRLVDALGGWRAYLQERANTPENYPQIPSTEEMFRLRELLEFPASTVERVAQRRLASERTRVRSAPISPPTLSYAVTESEEERSQEIGIHLPIGAWLERSSSLASDDSNWGTAESEALRLKSLHSRLLSYAEAVAAKAELTQTLDRLEISRILEEFLKRQRSIQAIPEGELLAIRMELVDAEAQAELANARLLRTVEELAYQLGLSVEETSSLVDRLPLEPEVIPELPTVPKVRLDLQQSRDLIALRESEQERATVSQWMGGLELGLEQEQSDAGHQSRTVEISWRLPFGGEGSKRSQISQFQLEEAQAELELRHLQIKQEQREVERQKEIANNHLIRAKAGQEDAELWMEEQLYRYNGMLIGPHELLQAASRLRNARSRLIQAQQGQFVAQIQAHFSQAIAINLQPIATAAPMESAASGGH